MSLYGSGLFVLSCSPAGGQLSPTVWTLVVIGSATIVIVDREVKRSFFGFVCFESFCCRAVAGFLAVVKASHHSTDKESRDRLDLGVGCHQVLSIRSSDQVKITRMWRFSIAYLHI